MSRFEDALQDQYLKGIFKVVTAVYNTGNSVWQTQGEVPGGNHTLTSATDLASARSESEAYVSGLGYVQVSHWADVAAQESRSVWFLPA